jgi:hypothetical protein
MTSTKSRPRASTKLKDRITELAIMTRWSAAEINRYIRQDQAFSGEVIPEKRTLERLVRAARAPEDDQPQWSTKKRRRLPRMSIPVRDAIVNWALTPLTAAEIHRRIQRDPKLSGEVIPDERTVARRVRESRAPEVGQPEWSMENFSGEEARLIFDVLGARLQELNAPVRKFSHETAQWIVRIREVAPDLDPSACFLIARLYMVRSRSKANTEDLEMYLAIGPWKDEARFTRYIKAVEMGLFPPMPIWHRLVEALAPQSDNEDA